MASQFVYSWHDFSVHVVVPCIGVSNFFFYQNLNCSILPKKTREPYAEVKPASSEGQRKSPADLCLFSPLQSFCSFLPSQTSLFKLKCPFFLLPVCVSIHFSISLLLFQVVHFSLPLKNVKLKKHCVIYLL